MSEAQTGFKEASSAASISISASASAPAPIANTNATEDVATTNSAAANSNLSVPKPKRLACMICRKRKLKCDGIKPSCSTCSRLGHDCAYDEVRRKSGPKRGYVKALEERLKHVETLLKTQEPPKASEQAAPSASTSQSTLDISAMSQPPPFGSVPAITPDHERPNSLFGRDSPQVPTSSVNDEMGGFNQSAAQIPNCGQWEMIGLGLEEPLPSQENIDELHQIYFDKVHLSMPMIHKFRYLAAMNLAPNQRPPIALRYAIWTLASSVSDKYQGMKDLFYHRARKYIEADYMKGFGEHMISVAHAQTHVLLASYEFKMMYFPRAWMSTGSAVRLCQMIGLNRLDGSGLDVKQCLPPPRDWTEREERRRTFWMAFCEDRYGSIGTGWPMTIDERDITTHLPASEEAFEMSKPEPCGTLKDATTPAGIAKLSAFGGVVLLASLFGRNLIHLHRPDPDDRDHDLNGEFWKRHRQLDNILLNTSLCLPAHLKLPTGLMTPNIIFTNMSIHTSTICLHQAAIFKAEAHNMASTISTDGKIRCITAANEVASTMRMIAHMDLSSMNPFLAFCLYVAARVFVQYLKSRPDDTQVGDSLRFILGAMAALKRQNPLTESFLVQLDVDLESLMTRIPSLRTSFPRLADLTGSPSACGSSIAFNSMKNPYSSQSPAAALYRNECQFMRVAEDNGNPVQGPNLVDPLPRPDRAASASMSQSPAHDALLAANWLNANDRSTPGLSMSNGIVLTPLSGLSATAEAPFNNSDPDAMDATMTTEGTASANTHQKPNAPATPEAIAHTAGQPQTGGMGNRVRAGSTRSSLEAATANVSDATAATQAFFSNANAYGMSQAMNNGAFDHGATTNGDEYVSSWANVSTAPSMTPVAEGVLRTLMNLGPMDAMDLSSWDQHIQ
ncbi:hypothetical protein TD95_005218 [Thielaviopsis punctulata]|uniref:Zn(2)-C6 fungal-type domain-containing protein n=1 Tax=Thielaviopsis punctulata TaxID=72032 RepID=A0A0F4ZII4_9PEZI|nr:hypothetical protein TD95_005218 [Thielaviopsis punctulata]